MKRNRFIYDFDDDNAYIETDEGFLPVSGFKVKFAAKCGTTEIVYWPSTKAKRKKALEIIESTGVRPNLEEL